MRGGQACPEDDERADGDSMWKTITEVNFDEMLASILPELAAQVDPRRETEFLDKEMKDLKALMGGAWQAPDLLARVPLKGGRDIWLALHVEVQDKGGENFPERMFYHHSIIRFKYLKRKKYEEELVDAAGDGRRQRFARESSTSYRWPFSPPRGRGRRPGITSTPPLAMNFASSIRR